MTDSEKMDLILSKLTSFDERFDKIESEMQSMKSEIKDMKSEIQGMKTKIDKLSLGQLEIQKEIYMINRRISDTYNVALDALGTSAENRTWLEKGTLVN